MRASVARVRCWIKRKECQRYYNIPSPALFIESIIRWKNRQGSPGTFEASPPLPSRLPSLLPENCSTSTTSHGPRLGRPLLVVPSDVELLRFPNHLKWESHCELLIKMATRFTLDRRAMEVCISSFFCRSRLAGRTQTLIPNLRWLRLAVSAIIHSSTRLITTGQLCHLSFVILGSWV